MLIGVIHVSVPDPRLMDEHVKLAIRCLKNTARAMENRLKDLETEHLITRFLGVQ